MSIKAFNPAQQSAKRAIEKIYKCIDENQSFKLEAGAGAGKTHSLILSLNHVIINRGANLLRKSQRIACITFTNVAKEEIDSRIDRHPIVHSDTIHGFCWSIIKDFQLHLRKELPKIEEWSEKIKNEGIKEREINSCQIDYNLGHRLINKESIFLHHDDILSFMVTFLKETKFRAIFISKYPILFIDEYQDTDKNFIEALQKYFLETKEKLLIGFFGDSWQWIYDKGGGKIDNGYLKVIDMNSNFRSTEAVVSMLNRMRPELIQSIERSSEEGSAKIYHTNLWEGRRRNEAHWKNCLPVENAKYYHSYIRNILKKEEWEECPNKTKILMLTHRTLTEQQGYQELADVFFKNGARDEFKNNQEDHLFYFLNKLEPCYLAFDTKNFGKMFEALAGKQVIRSQQDKLKWLSVVETLGNLRNSEFIGEIIDHLIKNKEMFQLPNSIEEKDSIKGLDFIKQLRNVPYNEVILRSDFVKERTSYDTLHGVKGKEFENVLVILGGGWDKYNFNEMLELTNSEISKDKQEAFERSRNLLYVACSRAKKRLALLFTQKLSPAALITLENWFGKNFVHALPHMSKTLL